MAGDLETMGDAKDLEARARALLEEVPLVDGHNDVPWQYRQRFGLDLDVQSLRDTTDTQPVMHTDLARLEAGGVGAQFWSVYVPVRYEAADAVQKVVEQLDFVHRMAAMYPELEVALTADDVARIHGEGRVASLMGIEGGHCINNSLAVLRQLHTLGARYMTLTHSRTISWADSATDVPLSNGLSPFGEEVVREMNQLGMIVDLSHVSADVMRHTLDVTRAPVMFSHSSAFAVSAHPRNVPDDVLKRVAENGGVVMVNFLPSYVSEPLRRHEQARESAHDQALIDNLGDRAAVAVVMASWDTAHEPPQATLAQVADHIDHIRNVAGIDHVGLGSDFDGMNGTPVGLESVADYPALLGELLRRGYSEEDVKKVAGLNALRVLREVETVASTIAAAAGG